MRGSPAYTPYHPRWHRRKVSTYWWLERWAYLRFVLRELSSVFVAWLVVLTLLQLRALGRGPEAWADFQVWLKSPLLVALNVVSFLFVVFHAVTWVNLTPRALAVRVGGRRIPDWLIAGFNYAAWAAASAFVTWVVVGG